MCLKFLLSLKSRYTFPFPAINCSDLERYQVMEIRPWECLSYLCAGVLCNSGCTNSFQILDNVLFFLPCTVQSQQMFSFPFTNKQKCDLFNHQSVPESSSVFYRTLVFIWMGSFLFILPKANRRRRRKIKQRIWKSLSMLHSSSLEWRKGHAHFQVGLIKYTVERENFSRYRGATVITPVGRNAVCW